MVEPVRSAAAQDAASKRVHSLDAYRGLVMLAIASNGLGAAEVAKKFPKSPIWSTLAGQVQHAAWVGCTVWDLIQPSFMFVVGVSMAFSCAKRQAQGQSHRQMLRHAATRSAILIGLALLLSSNWNSQMTNVSFANVLAQIGLGYTFLFLLWGRKLHELFLTAAAILVAYWAVFAAYPAPGADFDYAEVGVSEDWEHLPGFEQHWDKNTNAASAADRWFLNLFPREKEFVYNEGGYATLNFAPSLATMIFGLMVGELLRGGRRPGTKFWWLLLGGLAGLAAGWALAHCFDLLKMAGLAEAAGVQSVEEAGVCPLIKRIWTPSWALFSAGWTCLLMAGFYLILDIARLRRWAFPLVVVGANPITMYMMWQLIRPWTLHTLEIHWRGLSRLLESWAGVLGYCTETTPFKIHLTIDLPEHYTELFPPAYAPMAEAAAAVLFLWLICYWLYRQRVFIRI